MGLIANVVATGSITCNICLVEVKFNVSNKFFDQYRFDLTDQFHNIKNLKDWIFSTTACGDKKHYCPDCTKKHNLHLT